MCRIIAAILMIQLLFPCHVLAEPTTYRPSETEGYTFMYQGRTAVVHRIPSGENSLHGVFFLPDEFDKGQQYPVLIFSHGYYSSSYADTDYLPQLTKRGIICYKFDFAGGSTRSRSGGDFLQMSLLTEKADRLAVIDDIALQPFVDPERIVLIGMSQGSAVTSLTAPEVSDRILGESLVYPAFNLLDEVHAQYASPEELPDKILHLNQYVGRRYFTDVWDIDLTAEAALYTGPALLIHGTADRLVIHQYSIDAATQFENARILLLDGAPHGFRKKEVAALIPELSAFLQDIGLIS